MVLRTVGWRGCLVAAGLAGAAVFTVSSVAAARPAAPALSHPAPAPANPAAPAKSGKSTGYTITVVARQCSAYNDIMANRSRNNIMESLQDLGKDSVYKAGQPIDPTIEQDNDPNCAPLNGWQFEVGSSYTKPGQLSVVTGSPLVITGDTKTVALLDAQGKETGKKLRGAYVYHVTDQQYELAQQNQLWVQGGTVQYPQLGNEFGAEYGFGVLRCAVNNANADNVESIAFPSGEKNVFCYAYYVNPAPLAATVTVRKEVTDSDVTQGFTFESNLSYNPDRLFSLQVSNGKAAAQDFVRSDSSSFGGPYKVREQVTSGWTLNSLSCSDTLSNASNWTVDRAAGSVSIDLAAGDHVTCTYADSPPRSPTLAVWKVTSGAAGGPFHFAVTGPVSHDLTASTTAPEEPARATENGISPTDYTPGAYTITEDVPPATREGFWRFAQVSCNGHKLDGRVAGSQVSVSVTLAENAGQACVFRNQFVSLGHIVLRLETVGGTATGVFLGLGPGETRYAAFKGATTAESAPARISNERHLPYGTWLAYSLVPVSNLAHGAWRLDSYVCSTGDSTEPARQMRVIRLSAAHPLATCTATYAFTPAPHILPTPSVPPSPPGVPGVPVTG